MKLLLICFTTSALAIAQRQLFYPFPIYYYLNALQSSGYPLFNGDHSDVGENGYIEPSFTEQNRGLNMNQNEALQGRNSHRNGGIGAEPRPIDGNLSSRTLFLFSTITQTVTSKVLCIPGVVFKDAAAAANICRRKRGQDLELFDAEELRPTSLSDVRIEPSVTPSFAMTREEANSAKLLPLLSSKDIFIDEKETYSNDHRVAKRFFRNRYVVPQIKTTYAFVTSLVRKTIKPGADGAILCRPYGVEIC